MNLSIHHFKALVLPSFWKSIFYLVIKEYWIIFAIFYFMSGVGSLFRGEFFKFLFGGVAVLLLIAALLIPYVVLLFLIKVFRDIKFRGMLIYEPYIVAAQELLKIKDEPRVPLDNTTFSEEFPDTGSRIGMAYVIAKGILVLLTFFILIYLRANS